MSKKESFEVSEVATETTKVIIKGDKQYDIYQLLAEIANDLAKIKEELVK